MSPQGFVTSGFIHAVIEGVTSPNENMDKGSQMGLNPQPVLDGTRGSAPVKG